MSDLNMVLLEQIKSLLDSAGISSGAATAANQTSPTLVSDADVTTVAGSHALAAGACNTGLEIQSSPSNAATVRIGGSGTDATHGFELVPGQSYRPPVTNASLVWYYSAAGGEVLHVVRS